jgi:hypothetical protein
MRDLNPIAQEHVVFTDFDGVEGILVDLNSKKYYQLNETAMLIWKGIEQGLSADEMAAQLVLKYEVTSEAALQNVEQLLNGLASYKLIEVK